MVDFFCEEAALVVEADGAGHYPAPRRDHMRDQWLASMGVTILRFENCQILHHTATVLERIRQAVQASRLPP